MKKQMHPDYHPGGVPGRQHRQELPDPIDRDE